MPHGIAFVRSVRQGANFYSVTHEMLTRKIRVQVKRNSSVPSSVPLLHKKSRSSATPIHAHQQINKRAKLGTTRMRPKFCLSANKPSGGD